MSKQRSMTSGNPLKLLILFAIPVIFGNAFQQLYTVADTAIIGKGLGLTALAALGSVECMGWLTGGIASGFTQGFSVKISQYFGAKDQTSMKKAIACAFLLSAGIAVIELVVCQIGLPFILNFLNVSDELRPQANLYTRILFSGLPFVVFFNYSAGVLRAVGDSKSPLYVMLIASCTNILLDLLAVFVWKIGIAGAAAATIFSQFLSAVLGFTMVWRSKDLRFSVSDIREGMNEYSGLLRLGLPLAAMNIVIALGAIVLQSVVNGFETTFIAGFTATNKLYGLLEIAAVSLGAAITTYMGQNIGAGRIERVKEGLRYSFFTAIGLAVFIGVILITFGHSILGLFISSEDPVLAQQAEYYAYRFLFLMSSLLPILYLLYVYRSSLQGLGNTVMPMVSGIVECILRVAVSVTMAKLGYCEGLYLAEILAWTGAVVVLASSYYSTIRKLDPARKG